MLLPLLMNLGMFGGSSPSVPTEWRVAASQVFSVRRQESSVFVVGAAASGRHLNTSQEQDQVAT